MVCLNQLPLDVSHRTKKISTTSPLCMLKGYSYIWKVNKCSKGMPFYLFNHRINCLIFISIWKFSTTFVGNIFAFGLFVSPMKEWLCEFPLYWSVACVFWSCCWLACFSFRYKLDIVTVGKNFTKIRKVIITTGFFFHAIVKNQPVYIHPSSALFQRQPNLVIYYELMVEGMISFCTWSNYFDDLWPLSCKL